QYHALFPESRFLLSSRSRKVRKSHLPDLPFQFSADLRAGTSRFLSRCMVVAKTAIVHCPGVDAVVAARANGRCLFLCRGCENCAGLAARRANPNLVQATDSLSFARPGIASGMGGLRRELRLASHRFADGAVSSLASHARGRLLCRGNLSSFERANLSARHLSLARNCSDCSFSFAELAAL